mmetsp:Transcript_12847/g.25578  ORF Transcript_12847/g.25578 Transcript_12847/m.25578 type:complete len:224 (-) Transcript_12847:39-710(-)
MHQSSLSDDNELVILLPDSGLGLVGGVEEGPGALGPLHVLGLVADRHLVAQAGLPADVPERAGVVRRAVHVKVVGDGDELRLVAARREQLAQHRVEVSALGDLRDGSADNLIRHDIARALDDAEKAARPRVKDLANGIRHLDLLPSLDLFFPQVLLDVLDDEQRGQRPRVRALHVCSVLNCHRVREHKHRVELIERDRFFLLLVNYVHQVLAHNGVPYGILNC